MSVILIADSGSTKTDWYLTDNGSVLKTFKTSGLNPYFLDSRQIHTILEKEFNGSLPSNELQHIWFYGSGCSSSEKKAVIGHALRDLFPGVDITVEHDLLGAARALFGYKKGIAGILGTGSNSCLYDGSYVIDTIFSMGYVFGDEGSGAYIGKKYLTAHLKKSVPAELNDAFQSKYPYTPEDILDNVYKKPFPSKFLASFTLFLKEHIDHSFVSDMVVQCFDDFFHAQVMVYKGYTELPFSCVGSVGYHFKDQLKIAAEINNITITSVLAAPMESLLGFHTSKFESLIP